MNFNRFELSIMFGIILTLTQMISGFVEQAIYVVLVLILICLMLLLEYARLK
jgi:hypothetical protein